MTYEHLRIALFGNIHQSKKNQYVAAIVNHLTHLGVQIAVEEQFATFITQQLGVVLPSFVPFCHHKGCQADMAISIGGDGTFLGTAAKLAGTGIPILGINTGHLGFLADVTPEHLAPALDALCHGDYVVEERSMLAVEKDGRPSDFHPYALNEVAVLKHDNSSLIEVSTYVNGLFLTDFLADGIILCTATGSTGYSLSVGGPIIVPGTGTLCLSAVAPHSLSVRPVVMRDDVEIRLKIRSRSGRFLLTADGKSESLPDSTTITLRKANVSTPVIKIDHKDFFGTLRDKLNWRGSNIKRQDSCSAGEE